MKTFFLALALLGPVVAVPALAVPAVAAATTSALGDLSSFETIASDTLALVKNNDLEAAAKRITDFESAWDSAEPALYPMNHDQWGFVDEAADGAISSLRAGNPVQIDAENAVSRLIAALKNPAGQ
jgi:hypothetical protein